VLCWRDQLDLPARAPPRARGAEQQGAFFAGHDDSWFGMLLTNSQSNPCGVTKPDQKISSRSHNAWRLCARSPKVNTCSEARRLMFATPLMERRLTAAPEASAG
jgi:hypothetical protein